MALRAGYYGLKRFLRNKLSILAESMTADISPVNPIAGKNDVLASIDLLDDTVGWIVKNFFNNKQSVADKTASTNRTITDTGVRVTNSEATVYGYVRFNLSLSVNTDYTISSKITRHAGVCHILVRGSADDTTYTTLLEKTYNTGDIEDTFNTGNNTYVRLYLYCSLAESVVGDITYDELMISKADAYKLSNIFAPYHASVADVIENSKPKKATFSDSTSANGNILLSETPRYIIAINCAYCADPYIYGGQQYAHLTDAAASYTIPAEGTTVTGTYLYYDIPAQANREISEPEPEVKETKKATKKKVIKEEE